MPTATRRVLRAYPEVLAVTVAAVVGLVAGSRLVWLTDHHGIDVLLAVLVFATAVTIDPAALAAAVSGWRRVVFAVGIGAMVLPVLAWVAAQVVAAGPARDGIVCIGLAPCEIASVAITGMAGGAAALSAGILVGSTLLSVALAGPVLALEAGAASTHPGRIVANLALVVALPLAAGLALRALRNPRARRARRAISGRAERAAAGTALAAVAALVALIAAEVHLDGHQVGVMAAIGVFLAGSSLLGWLIGRGAGRPAALALMLTTSMRDFAIAAALAVAAFGPAAAAPLGIYGIVVLVWGTAGAGIARRRATPGGR